MVRALASTINARGLTQAAAAELLGVAQPNLSRILSGHFRSVTVDHLVKHLVALGANVRVTIAPQVAEDSRGILVVDGPTPVASSAAARPSRPRP
jgi:transcriptional regulator with XRE-family HTH domain